MLGSCRYLRSKQSTQHTYIMSCAGGESCFPTKDETYCHYVMKKNVFVAGLCADENDDRSCIRRFCAMLLPFTFMYWLSIVEDVSSWTENDGWHMTLYSMLVLSCELLCLCIIVKVYQCLVVGCCQADNTEATESQGGCYAIMQTIWMLLTNLEIFVTIGMLVAGVIATFHIRGQLQEADGTVYEHGDLLKKRLKQQFLPICLIFMFGLDLLLNSVIFAAGKCCCASDPKGGDKQPLMVSP